MSTSCIPQCRNSIPEQLHVSIMKHVTWIGSQSCNESLTQSKIKKTGCYIGRKFSTFFAFVPVILLEVAENGSSDRKQVTSRAAENTCKAIVSIFVQKDTGNWIFVPCRTSNEDCNETDDIDLLSANLSNMYGFNFHVEIIFMYIKPYISYSFVPVSLVLHFLDFS